MKRHALAFAATLGAISFATAVLAFGSAFDGYVQSLYPVALLGAIDVPHAWLFNLSGFLLPGAIAAWIAMALRAALPKDVSWPLRIGAQLSLLAAVAFTAQGLLPLDASDLDASATLRHAIAWTLWWIAFVPGACLLAVGFRAKNSQVNAATRTLAVVSLLAAFAVALFAVSSGRWLPPGSAQRVADAAWFGWLIACGAAGDALRAVSRGAASSPGSNRTTER